MGTLHEDQYSFFILHSIDLEREIFRQKLSRENQNTHCTFNFFFNEAIYEIMWKNILE